MAVYRQVHVEFWQDGFVLDLTPEEKYFYLYLMTNSKTSQCGIYELPKRIIETETGYNRETVDKLLERFIDYDKIAYSDKTKEIMMKNWARYNFINSPKVKTCIEKELKSIKHKPFVQAYSDLVSKQYGYRIDTLSKDYGEEEEKEEEKEEEQEKEKQPPYVDIVNHLNSVSGKSYKTSTNKTRDLIKARWNEGFTLNDFKSVIDKKYNQWKNDPNMKKYIRPETLFGPKFEGYLNEEEGGNSGKTDWDSLDLTDYDFDKERKPNF